MIANAGVAIIKPLIESKPPALILTRLYDCV